MHLHKVYTIFVLITTAEQAFINFLAKKPGVKLNFMDSEKLHNCLVKKLHKEHVFWSYDRNSINQIPDDTLIEKVLLHLDMDDIKILFKLYPKTKIQRVWKENILSQDPMYHGLNRLYSFLLFNIKHPDRYIREQKNKRYKNFICKA